MFRAQHAIVSLLVASAIAVIGSGCSDDTKATPQAILTVSIATGSGQDCRDSGALMTDVGSFGNLAATPVQPVTVVKDGDPSGQGAASIACSVTPNGTNTFAVDATIEVTGATGGLFKVSGTFSTTGDQTNITVTGNDTLSANNYAEKDAACIVQYTQPNMGVAAGRVWGEFNCPNAVNASDPSRACKLEGQFRFENCGQ